MITEAQVFHDLPPVCRIDGARLDTRKPVFDNGQRNPKAGQDFATVQDEAIVRMVFNPPQLEKLNAFAIIPSSYHGPRARSPAAQRDEGEYFYLWADVDHGSYTKWEVLAAVRHAVGLAPRVIIYSTASHTSQDRRWRVLIALKQGIPGFYYSYFQQALISLMAVGGLNLNIDWVSERTAQLCILPIQTPEYEFLIDGYELLDLQHHELNAGATYYFQARPQPPESTSVTSVGPRTFFNEACNIEDVLLRCGFDTKDGKNWRSPYQRDIGSGNYSSQIRYYNDRTPRVVTLSQTDAENGICLRGQPGAKYWDAFDLIAEFEYEGDVKKATDDCRMRFQYNIRPDNPSPHLRSVEAMTSHGALLAYQVQVSFQRQAVARLNQTRQEAQQDKVELRNLIENMRKVKSDKWRGPWLDEVPFEIEHPSQLEYMAWHAPGIIGELVRSYAPKAKRRTLVPLLTGAIAFVSYATQGRYCSLFRYHHTPPSIMIVQIGSTGAGKSDADDIFEAAKEKMHSLGIHALTNEFSSFTSGVGLHVAATQGPVVFMNAEFGANRAAAAGDRNDMSVWSVLTDLYTRFSNGLAKKQGGSADTTREAVNNPCISACVSSTPDKYFGYVSTYENVESGAAGRWIVVELPDTRLNLVRGQLYQHKDVNIGGPRFEVWLRTVGSFIPEPLAIASPQSYFMGREKAFFKLTYPPEAELALGDIALDIDESRLSGNNLDAYNKLAGRAPEAINRLATILALADSSTVVKIEHVQWAYEMVKMGLDNTVAGMVGHVNPEASADEQKVAALFDKFKTDVSARKRFEAVEWPQGSGNYVCQKSKLRDLFKGYGDNSRKAATETLQGLIEDGVLAPVVTEGSLSPRMNKCGPRPTYLTYVKG